jgi:hypothetical protein
MSKAKKPTEHEPARREKKKRTRPDFRRSVTNWWDKENVKVSSVRLCGRCLAVLYDGHWHTAPSLAAVMQARKRPPKKDVLCHECHWAVHEPDRMKEGWEGELTLDGLADPETKALVLATVRNVGKRAETRDPEDRIIGIDDRGERVVITTTENQLAVSIGKQVARAFKGGKLAIAWSSDDLPARVHWTCK